ncbi:MAG: metallophosphatase family protein [Lachnospiraceae bacterium]|nr:metallophosphatase family protein [Lachnospiraceae bacterium]
MKTHKIAVLSDTHGLLRPEVIEHAQSCEMILHAGDFDNQKVLDALEAIAPVYAVRGNNDRGWAAKLNKELEITRFGLRIYMVHNIKHLKKDLSGINVVVYGHSHKYDERTDGGVCYLNPGSCGPRRFRLPVTMAVLEVEEGSSVWQVRKMDLTENAASRPICEGSLKSTVEIILREMNAGHKVEWIAQKLGVECAFVEQVCRIYVTHPGVDAQGIVDKMEVSALFEYSK